MAEEKENNLVPKIGLEIHVELATKTKMFCECLNDPYESHPNVNICEICTGQPGVLPVINKQAVELAVRLGLALGGKISKISIFERKNYYYPDLPKNYQISQYQIPLMEGGEVQFFADEGVVKKIRLRRIHLEEDTGKLIHFPYYSLVDFNRAGVPLLEIVTEPEIDSAETAQKFAEELILILKYLNISEAEPSKGQIRFEANISLGYKDKLGTKVEVKNLNSLKSLKEGIEYEIKRQKDLILKGEEVIQETRGWDEHKRKTFSQRTKEEAEDYRYFPEPDLPPLVLSEDIFLQPKFELPIERRIRLQNEYGLDFHSADLLVRFKSLGDYFENAISEIFTFTKEKEIVKTLYNILTSELVGLMEEYSLNFEDLRVSPENFAHLVVMFYQKKISSRILKDLLKKMLETGSDPEELIRSGEFTKISDEEKVKEILEKVISENQPAVIDYQKGKARAFEFLVGQAMKITKGKIDPEVARKILKQLLNK